MQKLIQYVDQDSAIAKLIAKNYRDDKPVRYFGSMAKVTSFQLRSDSSVRIEMELQP